MLFGNIFAFVFHVYRFHNNQNVFDRIHADILHLQSMIWPARGGFSELGAPGEYRNGALYICTHLPRSTLRFIFVVMLSAAQ